MSSWRDKLDYISSESSDWWVGLVGSYDVFVFIIFYTFSWLAKFLLEAVK